MTGDFLRSAVGLNYVYDSRDSNITPRKGEKICVPGYAIECIDVSGSRITRVKVTEEPVATGLAD